jgi:hypothetical protein
MLHTNKSEDKTKSRKRKTHRIGIRSILRSCICLPRITIELVNESVIGESVRETAVIGATRFRRLVARIVRNERGI